MGELTQLIKQHYRNVWEPYWAWPWSHVRRHNPHQRHCWDSDWHLSFLGLRHRFQTGISRSALGYARVHREVWRSSGRRRIHRYKHRNDGRTSRAHSSYWQTSWTSILWHLEGVQSVNSWESYLLWSSHFLVNLGWWRRRNLLIPKAKNYYPTLINAARQD